MMFDSKTATLIKALKELIDALEAAYGWQRRNENYGSPMKEYHIARAVLNNLEQRK